MTRILDNNWIHWVRENINLGVPKREIFNTLVNRGFHFRDIAEAMNWNPEDMAAHARELLKIGTSFHERRFVFKGERINTLDDAIDIFKINNFLSKNQCKKLVGIIKSNMKPSTVTQTDSELDYLDPDMRTSSTCDLDKKLHGRVVGVVDERISQALGIHTLFSEQIQGQHYKKGQYFKEHTDTFTPGTVEYEKNCTIKGQRTWTVMIYLNEPQEGGETIFPQVKTEDGSPLIIKPVLGQALAWNNLYVNGEVNENTLHEATPVTKGVKTVITKWFREKRGS